MIGNNPSYVVPREILDYKTSYELIEELTARYIDEQSKNPGSNLEIEMKTGYSVIGRDPSSDHFRSILYNLSYRDFIIIGLSGSKASAHSYFGVRDVVGEQYHLSKEKMSKKRYLDIRSYFEKESEMYPGKIKETKNEFSIDFAMSDGSRFTYNIKTASWKRIKKNDKTSVDILHKSYPYRISFSFEEDLEFNEEEFIKLRVRNIRIKDRKSYNLEYMEYSLTEVVQYEQGMYNLEEIKTSFLTAKNRADEALKRFGDLKLKMMEDFEIEVEIIDKEPFARTLRRPEFTSYLKRFIRNSEALFLIPQHYNEQISMQFCDSDKFHMPKIGQYFSEYYVEKLKSQNDDF